jgi:hypothetical protein
MNNHKNFTSMGKTKLGEAENGHEFELKTIAEKSTKNKSDEFYESVAFDLSYLCQ